VKDAGRKVLPSVPVYQHKSDGPTLPKVGMH